MPIRVDANEPRCSVCGCYLGTVDTSTESGYSFEWVCNNPLCKSNGVKIPDHFVDDVQQEEQNAN